MVGATQNPPLCWDLFPLPHCHARGSTPLGLLRRFDGIRDALVAWFAAYYAWGAWCWTALSGRSSGRVLRVTRQEPVIGCLRLGRSIIVYWL